MLSFLLTALAASVAVSAQVDCTTGPHNIASQSDLTSLLSACTNVTGDLIISSTIAAINLGALTSIDGNLQVINNSTSTIAAVTSITASSLTTISGTMTLTQLTGLATLSMPVLTSVGGLAFTTLPVLSTLGFTNVINQCQSLSIINTGLTSLSGISLTSVSTMILQNNNALSTITQSVLTSVASTLNIAGNVASGSTVSMPVLGTAGNVTMQQVGTVTMPALVNITGSFVVQLGTFSTLSTANLTTIAQSLAITNNTQLTNLSMPSLTTLGGGLQITNNSQLATITFPSLTTIGGAVNVNGAFTNFTLPAIKQIRGGLDVESTSSSFTCPSNLAKSSGVILGVTYICGRSGATSSTAAAVTTTATSTKAAAATTTSAAAAATTSSTTKSGANAVTAGLAGVASFGIAALFFVL